MTEPKNIIIKVNSANIDVSAVNLSTYEPYVYVKLGEIKMRSDKSSTAQPTWDEQFDFTNSNPNAYDTLEVSVFSKGAVIESAIGSCQVKMSQLMMGTGVKESFTLLYKNRKTGTIEIESIYGALPSAPSKNATTVEQ